MPHYEVIVTRDATESVVLTVAARSRGEACEKAKDIAENNPGLEWTVDDGNFHMVYTNGADLIEPDPAPQTRADLFKRPAWQDLDADTSGNPCVWQNLYETEEDSWEDWWSCQCDNNDVAPYESIWVGPEDHAEIALWESLPEAGA